MDDFRVLYFPDPYIFCLDPVDGHCKTVIDRFFSFLWTERRQEAGELEITAPEDVYWSKDVEIGDYIQFKGSSVSDHFGDAKHNRPGRYTMIVEAKYTKFDSDNGYTTYVTGRSLDVLLERRINLGVVGEHKTGAARWGSGNGSNDYRIRLRDGVIGGAPTGNEEYTWHPEWKADEDAGTAFHGLSMLTNQNEENFYFEDYTVPYLIENLTSDSINAPRPTYTPEAGAKLLTDLVRYNCGDLTINPKRRFPNLSVRDGNLAPFDELYDYGSAEAIDGKFENVYTLIADNIAALTMYRVYTPITRVNDPVFNKVFTERIASTTDAGFRLVGWMEGVPGSADGSQFKMGFELFTGKDLTIGGESKGSVPVVYSRDMDNLVSMNYLNGIANYKNVIYYDTGLDYTPDDVWDKQKEVEKLEREKEFLDIPDQEAKEKREKELDDQIEKLNKEIEKLQDDYEDRGLRMPYVSVLSREFVREGASKEEQTIANYPGGLDRRELYVNEELPFYGQKIDEEESSEQVEWQGRPFADYRYEVKHEADPNVEGSKAWYEEKYAGIEWDYNTNISISTTSRATFADPDNSKENSVEAELNYNAIYQPKRNYDIGDLVTIMGLHHNEITRVARIDEMAYSIDSSGYTIIPTFTILPIEDDAV